MQLIQFIIIKLLLLLLTSSLINAAATGNSNDAINLSTKREDVDLKNPRDKRSLGLALLFSSLLQNSAPPQMPMTTTTPAPPPPQYVYNPAFGYQPNLPYVPDKNGYINFNVPDGYVLVTPPPPAPPTTQPPPPPTLPLKLQKKQSFLNFLATLSAGAQAPAPTTTTKAPPQGILIPKNLFPSYQQQLQQRAIYKYAQQHDISSDDLGNDVAPQYTYSATHSDEQPASSPDGSYYHQEGPGPVDSSYYKSSHSAYEHPPVYSSTTPDRFRITYPDDTEYYQPTSAETNQYQHEDSREQPPKQSSQEQLQSEEHGYSQSYGY